MSETKQIAYFESQSADGLSGFRLGGVIDGLHRALGFRSGIGCIGWDWAATLWIVRNWAALSA